MNIEDIKAAIRAEEQRLAQKYAADLEAISMTITAKEVRVWAYGTQSADRFFYRHAEGATPEEAIERLRIEHFPSNAQKVARLRDQARDLLRSAAELEKGGGK